MQQHQQLTNRIHLRHLSVEACATSSCPGRSPSGTQTREYSYLQGEQLEGLGKQLFTCRKVSSVCRDWGYLGCSRTAPVVEFSVWVPRPSLKNLKAPSGVTGPHSEVAINGPVQSKPEH
eukprot:1157461-Pelagomonas_calceolata.AAC.14